MESVVASEWARNDFERVEIQLAIAFVSGDNRRFSDGPVSLRGPELLISNMV